MKKQLYIHVGPPKTGTSILQSWLSQHATELSDSSKICYPRHGVDENQVSSGHNQIFLEKAPGKKSIFSHEKFRNLLNRFDSSDLNILLLSSEYFFYQIPEFLTYTDEYEIRFIAYIRPEYEFIESIYNQSVKRNRQNMPMAMRREIKYTYLDTLIEYIEKYGSKYFLLRAYGARRFFNENIIIDFLSIFNFQNLPTKNISIPIINSSYSFDCLEFKRWANKFLTESLDNTLDKKLQAYPGGTKDYTLLPHQTYLDYKSNSRVKISNINNACSIENYESLIEYIDNSKRPVYMHQDLYDEHLIKVLNFLINEDVGFAKSLFKLIYNSSELSKSDKHKLLIFKSTLEKARKRNFLYRFIGKLFR